MLLLLLDTPFSSFSWSAGLVAGAILKDILICLKAISYSSFFDIYGVGSI